MLCVSVHVQPKGHTCGPPSLLRCCMMIIPVMSPWYSQTRTRYSGKLSTVRACASAGDVAWFRTGRLLLAQSAVAREAAVNATCLWRRFRLCVRKVVRNKMHRMKEMRRMKAAERWAKKAGQCGCEKPRRCKAMLGHIGR